MADEYAHLPVHSSPGLQELLLGSFPTVEEQQFGTSPQQDTGQVPELVGYASTSSEKSD
jgi:hypothetical protein